MKTELGESTVDIKECKMSEIRSLQKINWSVDLDQCGLVERAIVEVFEILDGDEEYIMNKEEKSFIKTTTMALEHGLQRKCKIENLVERMSQ